jgi:hypothetical protein
MAWYPITQIQEFTPSSIAGGNRTMANAVHGQQPRPQNAQESTLDLTTHTDIAWINDLIRTGVDPALSQKYIRTDTSPWLVGLLVDPEDQLATQFDLAKGPGPQPKRSCDEVVAILKQAGKHGWPLEITAQLRGVDGPGSSQDLLRFQVKMTQTEKAFTWMFEMPATTAIASEFSTRIRVEAADKGDEDKIVYVAPDYFDGAHVRSITDPEDLRNEHGLVSMKDLPAYSLSHYFGITRGIKITCEPLSPLPKEGGMESSNAFSTSVYAIGSMLSGANWSWAKIIKHAVYDENTLYGDKEPGITGGQGHASSCLGGANTLIWCSGFGSAGIKDDETYIYETDSYGIFAVPLLTSLSSTFYDRLFLCQPGKDFVPGGKPKKGRLASDTNFEWTEEWKDEVGQTLHLLKKELHYIWKRAAEQGDDQAAAYALNQYSRIRLALNERYKQWYRATTGSDASGGVGYMDEYSSPLFKKITDVGGGFMPAGAGGIGSVCIVYLPENVDAAAFFKACGMDIFDSENANQVKQSGCTLKGYLPFKSSDEPMTLSTGWQEIGASVPENPPLVAVNQNTGEVLSIDDFSARAQKDQLPLSEETLSQMSSVSHSIQAARALAGDINTALLR